MTSATRNEAKLMVPQPHNKQKDPTPSNEPYNTAAAARNETNQTMDDSGRHQRKDNNERTRTIHVNGLIATVGQRWVASSRVVGSNEVAMAMDGDAKAT